MATNKDIIITLTGDSTGIERAAASGSKALAALNKSIASIASSNATWNESLKRLQAANGRTVGVVTQARQVAAQLRAEKERLIKVEELLISSLSKQDVAILRSAGVISTQTTATQKNTLATQQNTAAKKQNTSTSGAAAVATQNLAHANGSASFALLSLGQAFQDSAQFGMGFSQGLRAINNNIQQTFTAIALGATQVGGFANLMRAMASSLMGPAGLIIGFSILSAGLEFFATRSQRAKKNAEELENTLSDLVGVLSPSGLRASGAGLLIVARVAGQVGDQLSRNNGLVARARDLAIEHRTQQILASKESLQAAVNYEMAQARAHDATWQNIERIGAEMEEAAARRQAEREFENANREAIAKTSEEAKVAIDVFRAMSETKQKEALQALQLERQYSKLVTTLGVDGLLGVMRSHSDEFAGSNWIVKQAEMIHDAEKSYADLENRLKFLNTVEGQRVIALELQEAALQRQLDAQFPIEAAARSGLGSVSEFIEKFNEVDAILRGINVAATVSREQFAALYASGQLEAYIKKMRERYTVETDLQKVEGELKELRERMNSQDFEKVSIAAMQLDISEKLAAEMEREVQLRALLTSLQETSAPLDQGEVLSIMEKTKARMEENAELERKVRLLLLDRGYSEEQVEHLIATTKATNDQERALDRLNNAFIRVASQGIGSMIENLAALPFAGGNAATALLGPMADMAIRLGKLAIGAGIAVKGIREALENLHGPVAIAAGVALVALGSAVKSRIRSLSKSASGGGSVSGGGGIPSMPSGFGATYGSNRGFASFSGAPSPFQNPMVTQPWPAAVSAMPPSVINLSVSGRDLVTTTQNEMDARGRMSGGGGVMYAPGRTLVAAGGGVSTGGGGGWDDTPIKGLK